MNSKLAESYLKNEMRNVYAASQFADKNSRRRNLYHFFFEPKTAREAPAVEILLRKTKGVTIIT
jgi:hypothetical protein